GGCCARNRRASKCPRFAVVEKLLPKDQPMFHTHLAAFRFTLAALVASALGVGIAAAQSAGNSDDQWRPAGVVRPTNVQSAATSSPAPANQTWRLPNGQTPSDANST